MEKTIRDRFHNGILQGAMDAYGIRPDQIQLLDGFESFMYAFSREDGDFILRIGHSHRRSVDLIRGEVDWINYLAAGGAGVAPAVYSINRRLVEEIPDGKGETFLTTAFVRAKGGLAWERGLWNDELFVRYGRLLGRIHRLSKSYEPSDMAWRRPEWDDPININMIDYLSPADAVVREKFDDLMGYLHNLPKDDQSYGLIHQDAHAGNFFVDDAGNITLFDFDDCAYSWYVYDLAMAVFYAVTNRDDAEKFGKHFWSLFWSAYQQENNLDPRWLRAMPAFMKLREIDLYAILRRDADDVELMNSPWTQQFMQDRREKIANDVPYVDIDFA